MTEAMKPPNSEERVQMSDSLQVAKVHAWGDFTGEKRQQAMEFVQGLETEYAKLIDLDPSVRIGAVATLGGMILSERSSILGVSRLMDASATHILASCIKDPDMNVRMAARSQLNHIISKMAVTSMPYVVAVNAMTVAPKWDSLLSKLPKIPKLF